MMTVIKSLDWFVCLPDSSYPLVAVKPPTQAIVPTLTLKLQSVKFLEFKTTVYKTNARINVNFKFNRFYVSIGFRNYRDITTVVGLQLVNVPIVPCNDLVIVNKFYSVKGPHWLQLIYPR